MNYIACDTIEYAKMHNNRAVKKTLTIPEWLNEAGYESRGKLFSGSSRSTDEKLKYKQIIIGELGDRLSKSLRFLKDS